MELFEYYKKTKSPIWNLFINSPHSLLEIKGEWSLLSIDTELSLNSIDGENEFFGYKKTPLKYTTSDDSVIQIKNIIENHLDQIINDEPFFYPKPNSYHYPKFSDLKLLSINNFDMDLEEEIYLFKFDEDSIFDEMEKAEFLLMESKSGNKYYGVDIDEPEEPIFEVEDRTDKVPGKIISHRMLEDKTIELLMKWKYLSIDESTWVKYDIYKDQLIVKEYLTKIII